MSADDVASATDLTSYGDALIAACVAYAETAARFVDDDDDEKNAAGTDDVDAMTTRACVRACARLDAEATKVGVFFRDDDDASTLDNSHARGILAALHDAHAALTMEVARTLAANGGRGARYYRRDVADAAATCAEATCAVVRACCAANGEGRAAKVRASVGRVWEASKSFARAPKDAVRAISGRLMRCARFIKDVSDELKTLGAEDADAEDGAEDAEEAGPIGLDEDDLRFCDDDFDEDEMRRAKATSAYATACTRVLKTLIAPTVRERRARVDALEPMVEACEKFQRAVEEIGAGAYPPHDAEEMIENIGASVRAAEEMRACAREAGVADEDVESRFADFVDAAATAKRAASE